MRLTRGRLVTLAIAVLLLAGVGAGVAAWFVVAGGGSGHEAAQHSAEEYFSFAEQRNFAGTYELLALEAQQQMSAEEWQARNEEALTATGELRQSRVLAVEPAGEGEAYATVELTFGDNEPLVIVVLLVREAGEWKLLPSVDEAAEDDWEYIEPEQDTGQNATPTEVPQ